MSRYLCALACSAMLAAAMGGPAQAQQQQQSPIETRKVDGTDNVYIFRNRNHQAMFIVTPDGVIATDPVGYGRPTGGQDYINEIRKITQAPIRYLIYSHHHFDHIAGGKAFKDAGATIIAHKRAKERLEALKDPHTPVPDETVDMSRTITLGGTTLELNYVGLNHSDSTLVMRLPRERIVFIVDLLPVGKDARPRHDRFLSDGGRKLDRENPRDGLGSGDPRPSRRGRSTRHQEGRSGSAHAPANRLGGDAKAGT